MDSGNSIPRPNLQRKINNILKKTSQEIPLSKKLAEILNDSYSHIKHEKTGESLVPAIDKQERGFVLALKRIDFHSDLHHGVSIMIITDPRQKFLINIGEMKGAVFSFGIQLISNKYFFGTINTTTNQPKLGIMCIKDSIWMGGYKDGSPHGYGMFLRGNSFSLVDWGDDGIIVDVDINTNIPQEHEQLKFGVNQNVSKEAAKRAIVQNKRLIDIILKDTTTTPNFIDEDNIKNIREKLKFVSKLVFTIDPVFDPNNTRSMGQYLRGSKVRV